MSTTRWVRVALATGLLLAVWGRAASAEESVSVPGHVEAVTAALKLRLDGVAAKQVEADLAVRGSAAIATEPGFRFEGFALRRVVYAGYTPPDGDSPLHRLSGFLQYSDAIDRRVSVAFGIAYSLDGSTPVVARATWRIATPADPTVEAFFVPAAKMAEGDGKATGADGFYDHVIRNAVAKPGAEPYWIIVFLKDRLETDAAFEVVTSDSEEGTDGDRTAVRYLLEDGWVTAILIDPRGPSGRPPRFVKANFTPGISVAEGERTARTVAVLSLSGN